MLWFSTVTTAAGETRMAIVKTPAGADVEVRTAEASADKEADMLGKGNPLKKHRLLIATVAATAIAGASAPASHAAPPVYQCTAPDGITQQHNLTPKMKSQLSREGWTCSRETF